MLLDIRKSLRKITEYKKKNYAILLSVRKASTNLLNVREVYVCLLITNKSYTCLLNISKFTYIY